LQGQLQAPSSRLPAASCQEKHSFRHGSMRITRERGQLTSRSGVLKEARSRVIIDENAKGGGGLAGAAPSSQLPAPGSQLPAARKSTPSAMDQRGLRGRERGHDDFRHGEPGGYRLIKFSKTSEGLSSPRILECVSKLCIRSIRPVGRAARKVQHSAKDGASATASVVGVLTDT